jgi:beta-galactosidase
MRTPRYLTRSLSVWIFISILAGGSLHPCLASPSGRKTERFCKEWKFRLGDSPGAEQAGFDDNAWRRLELPHDWSIEGPFSESNPATPGGGALPGGIGWYRKEFTVPESDKGRLTFVAFDGIYRNSEVWINGHLLGMRPYGYSSFEYELTPYLHYGGEKNVLAVRVDNSRQPNSRWYSGSGIYRSVWLTTTDRVHVDHWGTYVITPRISANEATVAVQTRVRNSSRSDSPITLKTLIVDGTGKVVAVSDAPIVVPHDSVRIVRQTLTVSHPVLWSIDRPALYRVVSNVEIRGESVDTYETTIGIRSFNFDEAEGFSLNGVPMKIKGVCDHHDLGCLGAAVNVRALERQVEMLKAMGANALRTSHNPPAPELLDLCDRLGVIVLDEAFDMWHKGKTPYDYSLDWDAWHRRDLTDMVLRDRNHPSVCMWSIGNEVMEQWEKDSSGVDITRELTSIVKELDSTRPVTAACNGVEPDNPLFRAGVLDLIGMNYHIERFPDFPVTFPGKKFLATETTSALETRGSYDMPSDSIRRWPIRWDVPFVTGNPDNTCSAYDNCSTPWGSTHEETWKVIKKYNFLSGMFVWTGFDYLGEPTPYGWPSRSSYFGIIDLAGFPKDAYYFYQSEWTDRPVLHLFPHWNWRAGQTVDVWAYTNCSEVELFLNGKSLGTRQKAGDTLHLTWRVPYVPGTLKAVGRAGGKEVLVQEVKTAGPPATLLLEADRKVIAADGQDLAFVTVKILDAEGTLVPRGDNLIHFVVSGPGTLVGVDNGLQTSHESFVSNMHRAWNGLCLAVVRAGDQPGEVTLTARADGLQQSSIVLQTR